MPGYRNPGSLGATPSKPIDSGTLNKQRTPEPKPVGSYGPAVLAHRWVDAATYHRTFLTLKASQGVYHYDLNNTMDEAYYRATPSWIQAYEFDVSAGSFTQTFMVKKPDQDFANYATPFEQESSNIVKPPRMGSGPGTVPVVVRQGDDYLVVGY